MSSANLLTSGVPTAPCITSQYAGLDVLTGTASAGIGTSQAITFGGDLAGAVLEPNAVYLFTACLLVGSTAGAPGTDTLDFAIDCATISQAAVGCWKVPIPFLLASGEAFISVSGIICNGDTTAQALAGDITFSAPATYSSLTIRKPSLIRIA